MSETCCDILPGRVKTSWLERPVAVPLVDIHHKDSLQMHMIVTLPYQKFRGLKHEYAILCICVYAVMII